jgi:hypothetical protein
LSFSLRLLRVFRPLLSWTTSSSLSGAGSRVAHAGYERVRSRSS